MIALTRVLLQAGRVSFVTSLVGIAKAYYVINVTCKPFTSAITPNSCCRYGNTELISHDKRII